MDEWKGSPFSVGSTNQRYFYKKKPTFGGWRVTGEVERSRKRASITGLSEKNDLKRRERDR